MPDIAKMTEAIGASFAKMTKGYSRYTGTASKPHPTLSQQCKERRDQAIMEFHAEGKGDREIARLCGMNHMTVGNVIKDCMARIEDSSKFATSQQSPVMPVANTNDRPDTREEILAIARYADA